MKTFVLATSNQNKLKEFQQILPDWEIKTLKEIGFDQEIEETGETFEENAMIKAEAVQAYLRQKGLDYIVVAEDSGLCVDALDGAPGVSGLCVDALDGAPGVYTARYAGEHGDYRANIDKLWRELAGKESRTAYYICVLAILYPDDERKVYIGKTEGEIIDEERGANGFAYDVVFYSKELQKTFGEAEDEEKNQISHRARAIKQLVRELEGN